MWQEVRYNPCMAMSRKLFTTVEAAAAAGVPRATLQNWIKTRRIRARSVRLVGGKATRFWTKAHVERIRQLKGTLKPGPKGRARSKGISR
jgi:hypothetical protein